MEQSAIATFEIERMVISCLVNDHNLFHQVELVDSDFADPSHRKIFRHIRRRLSVGRPADFLLLMDGYRTKHPECADSLADIVRLSASPANFPFYVEALQKKAAARRLVEVAAEIDRIARGGGDTDEIMGRAQLALTSVTSVGGGDIVEPSMYLEGYVDFLDQLQSSAVGLQTGFETIDARLRGLRDGDLMIVAARPAMGKTTYGLNILTNAAMAGKRVMMFSLEMSQQQVVGKVISNLSSIPGDKFLNGLAFEEPGFVDALNKLKSSSLLIDDTPGLNIHRLCQRARKQAAIGKLDLILVDYLGLIAGDTDSRYENVSRVSSGLKSLARELKTPIIALAQLNRGVEQRENKRPGLSDLRDSGSIEQDADIVQFLFRPDYYQPEEPKLRGLAEVITAKFRLGETGTDAMQFTGKFSRFSVRPHVTFSLDDLPV